MKINLAGELLLLAYDDSGVATADSQSVTFALAGALLVELALAGRIDVVDGRVAVTDPRPTDDPILDDALARLGSADKPRKPKDWVEKLGKGLRDRLLDQLVQAGILRRERDKVFWIVPRTRYPSTTGAEPAVETDTRRQLLEALDGTGQVDARTAGLCALVRAAKLHRAAFPDRPRGEVDKRLKAIAEANWAADAVRKAIEEVELAVAVAVTTAAVTTTTATNS